MKGDVRNNDKSNLTLSLDSQVIKQLKNDAEIQGLSVNAKVNSILSKYLFYYKLVEEQQAVTVSQKAYARIIDELDEDKFRQLVNLSASETVPSLFIHNNIPFTMDNLIKYCFQSSLMWSGAYCNFHFYKDGNDAPLCLVFEHRFGLKWSKILGESFSKLISDMLNLDSDFTATPNTLLIRVTS